MRIILALFAALFCGSSANAAVTYQFTALSGGYNTTGSFTIITTDYVTGNSSGAIPGAGYAPPFLISCEASTGGFAGVGPQALPCGAEQYLLNDVTRFTPSGTPYDVVGFTFAFPGNSPSCCSTVYYYFDASGFQNAGHYESLVLGPGQAGTLDVIVSGSVPEASSWTMMLLGFSGIGLVVRRRRSAAATPALGLNRIAPTATSAGLNTLRSFFHRSF